MILQNTLSLSVFEIKLLLASPEVDALQTIENTHMHLRV